MSGKSNDGHEHDTLIPPFNGIHGWHLNNETDQDITIDLNIAGTFEEVEN